jgi:hypothetical protein
MTIATLEAKEINTAALSAMLAETIDCDVRHTLPENLPSVAPESPVLRPPKSDPKTTDFITVARWYTQTLGWPVFPLRGIGRDGKCTCGRGDKCPSKPGKHPLTRHAKKDATRDLSVLAEMVASERNPGWSAITGRDSGIIVIDIDGENGENSVQQLANQFCELTATVEAKSGSGGRHLYYRDVAGVRTSSSKLAPNIDIRADNGSIILPPTLHACGGRYEWVNPPLKTILAPLPNWIPILLKQIEFDKADERRVKYENRSTGAHLGFGTRGQTAASSISGAVASSVGGTPALAVPESAYADSELPVAAGRPESLPTTHDDALPPVDAYADQFAGQGDGPNLDPAVETAIQIDGHSADGSSDDKYVVDQFDAETGELIDPDAPPIKRPTISERALGARSGGRQRLSSEERLRQWRADPDRALERIGVFADEVAMLGLKSGRRNDSLNRNAYIAFRVARDAGIPDRVVIQAFVNAGTSCGLQMPEVLATIRSAQHGVGGP